MVAIVAMDLTAVSSVPDSTYKNNSVLFKKSTEAALLSWQESQGHPRNRKERKEQRAQEEPGAFRTLPLCGVFCGEAAGQKRHGENGDS
jgi:hypothetical protein